MKLIRYVAMAAALSCAVAAGNAFAAGSSRAQDRDISRQVATDLIQNTAIGPYGIRVRTRDGVVHMTGSVGSIRDWKRANEDARNTAGVTEVQNNLSILNR